MRLEATFLRSKVGRRMFALFVCSALVPIAALAVLSYHQVARQLNENGYQQLHRESKAVGMAIYERLTLLDSELRLHAARLGRSIAAPAGGATDDLPARFGALAVTSPASEPREVLGDLADPPVLGKAALEHLRSGKTVLSSRTGAEGTARIFLSRALDPHHPERGVLSGEIDYPPLWDFELGRTIDLCVLNARGAALFCNASLPARVLDEVRGRLAESSSGRFEWVRDGRTHLTQYWAAFFQPAFLARQWTVVLSEPESDVLAAMSGFKSVFPPVIVLALLTVLLLTITQIRKQLVPLERLSEATRRISKRDFDTPVRVRSGDEFEELADSFNAMSERLQKQFKTLSTMSEIDRMILSALDADYIVETLLTRMRDVVTCDYVCVAVLQEGRARTATVHVGGGDGAAVAQAHDEQVCFTAAEMQELGASAGMLGKRSGRDCPAYLEPLQRLGATRFLVFPVLVKNTLAAVVSLGFREVPQLDSDDVARVQGLADRAAVALSNAAWEDKLYRQAHYDALTGLPNRALLEDRLDQALARAKRNGHRVALLFVDIDRFKTINDSLGHGAGDLFLQEIASRLREHLREVDTVVRFGGDEFVVVIPDIDDSQDAVAVVGRLCRKLLQVTGKPYVLNGHELRFTVSIGVALFPDHAITFTDLLKFADTAMYQAKSEGSGGFGFYTEDWDTVSIDRLNLESDLRRAIERGGLELHYQPQIEARSGKIVGVEALLRWHHPVLGMVSPARFIPLAEESGLIAPLGDWVLTRACSQAREWLDQGLPPVRIAVNLSARQFRERDLVASVGQVLRDTDLDVSQLELEVTEGAIMTDIERTTQTLRALSDMGVGLTVDDFGTGYSSLAYLAQFPIDCLKVDQSFVRRIVDEPDVCSIVSAIVSLAHSLKLRVVAEGVETDEQFKLLRALRCEEMQGYLFSRPLPAAEIAALLARRRAGARAARRAQATG